MAKTSSIVKERKKVKLVHSGEKKRAELRKAGKYVELQKLPRNTSRIRVTNRCQLCGRPKAVYRRFEMCRICIRNLLMNGDIPGGVKSSW